MKRNIISIIKVLRLQSVLAMNLFIFLPIFIITKEFLFSLVQTLPYILMISGEIALNDCCDVEKDRINKPHRPLVRYNPNIKYVLSVAVVLILISGMLAIGVYYNSPFRILLFFIVVALLTLYNSKKAIIPFIKTFMTALATVLSLLFAYSYLSMTIEDAFFLIAAFFLHIRERIPYGYKRHCR